MKKQFLLLLGLCICAVSYADTYIITDGEIYYKNQDSVEIYVNFILGGAIPNDEVYIRMSPDVKKFRLKNQNTGETYMLKAPQKWPGIKLKDCIKNNKVTEYSEHVPMNRGIKGDFYANPSRSAQFHYLCVFSNEYDDERWNSFDDNDKIVSDMETALGKLINDKQYNRRPGLQYTITPKNATRSNITNHLDTIFRHTIEGDMVFIYLSGHGEYDVNGNFHFIVKDSRFKKDSKNIENAFPKEKINYYINRLTNKGVNVLLFVDACNAGDLAYNDNVQGKAVYYLSTQKKSNAYTDKNGSHFARALIDAINGVLKSNLCHLNNRIDVGSLGQYLNCIVYSSSNHRQYPQCELHDFIPDDFLWETKFTESKESLKNKDIIQDKENCSPDRRAIAMLDLGDAYLSGKDRNGDSTIKSADSAYLWYSQVERMKSISKKTLAKAYYGLYNYSRNKNETQTAVDYLIKASKMDKKALYELGICYIDGYGVHQDNEKAITLIKKAAKGKDACSDAQCYLGFLYHQRAIAQLYVNIKSNLILTKEEELKKIHLEWPDDDEWRKTVYYANIIGEGFYEAFVNSKFKYVEFSNDPHKEFMNKSINWYEKAIKAGNAQAKFDMGKLYYSGDSIYIKYHIGDNPTMIKEDFPDDILMKKDKEKGLQMIKEAAQDNCKDAITFLKKLNGKNE